MLRNLAAQKEQQSHSQAADAVYDKLRILNGQTWPRPSPWYPGSAAFGAIPAHCVPTVPPPTTIENGNSHKKGLYFRLYSDKKILIQILKKYTETTQKS